MQPGNREAKETKKIDVDLTRERAKQPPKNLSYYSQSILDYKVGPFLYSSKTDMTNSLARLCVPFYKATAGELNKQALIEYQRAALNGDRARVTAILENATPQRLRYLLTTNPAAGIPTIVSNTPPTLTWQTLKSIEVFRMVQYLGYLEMAALIFSCFEQHEELREELYKQVVVRKYNKAEKKIMREYYKHAFCDPCIEALVADITFRYEAGKISNPRIKDIIDAFRNKLLPQEAIDLEKLDTPEQLGGYPDMEQLCQAFAEAYEEKSYSFKTVHQRRAYSIFFEGLIFTLLGRGDSEKFCHGLSDWVNGCSVLLMKAPSDDRYEISDLHNLPLYLLDDGQVIYFIENDPKPKFLDLTGLKFPERSEFNATPIKLTECVEKKLVEPILKKTSEQKHTVASSRILSEDARNLVMKDGRQFKRGSSEFLSGHGVNFVCGIWGKVAWGGYVEQRRSVLLTNYFKQKHRCVENLYRVREVKQEQSKLLQTGGNLRF